MDFSDKLKSAEPYLKTDPTIAADKAQTALRLCYEIKASLKRTEEGLQLHPNEWEGVSAQAHRQFYSEIIDDCDDGSEAIDALIKKLNSVLQVYNQPGGENAKDGLPLSIL